MAETLTSSKYFSLAILGLFLISSAAAQDYYYNDDSSSSFGGWGEVPQFDSHEEIVYEFVAPFLFVFVLLQFSLKKTLAFTFANDDEVQHPLIPDNDGPNVGKESTVMALAISLMLVASPYWSLIQTLAASIGLLTVGGLILAMLFIIYLFVR
ncbi:hypothetical protein HRED_01751 [Candidatus Haloredivivus sp. G17]|jgi:hypothetical protein|nr:hypothetical protein HRED_01751 [Candidatus Haloredivivus sp. G17]